MDLDVKNIKTHKISAALITFNEEKNIERTLKQLTWCDEIVVVDSHSTDKTVEICEKFGAKVYFKKFNGFGEQKQFLVTKCNNDWILSIDADEVLTDLLIYEIKEEFSKDLIPNDAYFLNRKHVFLGKIFKYGRLKNVPVLRLFNKNKANFSSHKVHEKVICTGKLAYFKHNFLHYTATSIKQIMHKKNLYVTLSSEENFSKGKRVGFFSLLFRYPFVFVKEYFIYLNLLNGYEGYIWSVHSAKNNVLKYLKLRELNRAFNDDL